MKRSSTLVVLAMVTSVLVAGVREAASKRADPDGLVAHEWGTFTTVAGADGRAVDWLPLAGPADLPCFVERYRNGVLKGLPSNLPALTYEAARTSLPGKVRMETPVIYFYSPTTVTANVQVRFPRGVITEWYPRAIVRQPDVTAAALRQENRTSILQWRAVRVTPGAEAAFSTEPGQSHYYAARETEASPLDVGGQRERFLFYRGVGGFDVPISAVARTDGGVRVTNLGTRDVGGVVLFENRDGRLSYRTHGVLRGEATLARPDAVADPSLVRAELERILTTAGLYPREARAMVDTWRDSWFEEGTRVFYVLAPREIDVILPLAIEPRPAETTRVFVGRMEVITPQVVDSVRRAIAARDDAFLRPHGRFLGAIADRLLAQGASPGEAERIREVTGAAFAAFASAPPACR